MYTHNNNLYSFFCCIVLCVILCVLCTSCLYFLQVWETFRVQCPKFPAPTSALCSVLNSAASLQGCGFTSTTSPRAPTAAGFSFSCVRACAGVLDSSQWDSGCRSLLHGYSESSLFIGLSFSWHCILIGCLCYAAKLWLGVGLESTSVIGLNTSDTVWVWASVFLLW